MAFIATIPLEAATGEARAMYARGQVRYGYVPNHTKLFGHRPGVWAGWEALLGSIRSNMDPRRYELVTLAAARALRSSYCALAHGLILRERFYSTAQLTAIADDHTAAGLSPADAAIMSFAAKVARDADTMTPADVEVLRRHGLTDAEIFDVAAAAAARCFFSKIVDALGAEPDAAYTSIEDELRRRLTVGRDISTEAVERLPAPGTS
jgi:uncharacterized peroxidase-related enzyme